MSIHPDGTGTGWTNVETVDVNQAHGKDYLYSQHIAKGVRKRMNQEHSAFADATVGGIHKPGGAAVLGECDGTPGAADGTYRGHGLVWDMSSRLWCSTAAAGASTSGDFTVITLHPDLQWKGGDVTWAGAHEFDASVDISGNVRMHGAVIIDSSSDVSDVYVNGDISMTGSLKVATDVTITGDMAIDGTSNFYDEVDFSDVYLRGDVSGSALKVVSVFGVYSNQDDENNAMVKAHAYLANQDGFVTAKIVHSGTLQYLIGYIGATNDPAGAGDLIQSTSQANGNPYTSSISFPVAKGKYFEITTTSTNEPTIYWHPVGVLIKPTDNN